MRLTPTNGLTEFALVAPVLFLLVLGMCQFGITLNQYLTLTNAVRSGARQLSISRGGATPWTDTLNQIYGSAPNLTVGSLPSVSRSMELPV